MKKFPTRTTSNLKRIKGVIIKAERTTKEVNEATMTIITKRTDNKIGKVIDINATMKMKIIIEVTNEVATDTSQTKLINNQISENTTLMICNFMKQSSRKKNRLMNSKFYSILIINFQKMIKMPKTNGQLAPIIEISICKL